MNDDQTPLEENARDGRSDAGSFNPYIGPRPFERREELFFFGREREARDVVSLIIANQASLIYSQSGAGKSSLINTKVAAGLEAHELLVLPVARVQGKVPAWANESAIANIFSLNVILSLQSAEVSDLKDYYALGLSAALRAMLEKNPHKPEAVVLVIDQFEEFFNFYEHRWTDRPKFKEIAEALKEIHELKIVFAMREDYLAMFDPFVAHLPEKLRARYRLERLREAAAVAAITGPAEQTGRRFEPAAAQRLVEDLLQSQSRNVQGEPVQVKGEFIEAVQLQVICQSLWENVPKDVGTITLDHLQEFGNVDDVLRQYYASAVREVAQKTGTPEIKIRRWFGSDLITPAGTRGTVFRDVNDAAGLPTSALKELENRHLIRADWRASALWYEITHDRLLRPIKDSNREWFNKREKPRRLAPLIITLVILLIAVYSIYRSWRAEQEARAATQSTALANASVRLPHGRFDLALLLGVAAMKISDTPLTRDNLLRLVQRGDRVLRFSRSGDSAELLAGILLEQAKSVLVAVSTDGKDRLRLWNYSTGQFTNDLAVFSERVLRLFKDHETVYAITRDGAILSFDVSDVSRISRVSAGAPIELAERLRATQTGTPSRPNSTTQSAPAIEKSRDLVPIAFAAGRLVSAEANVLRIVDVGNNRSIATLKFEPFDESVIFSRRQSDPELGMEILDVGLSQDGRYAFAIGCQLRKAPDNKAPDNKSVCGGHMARIWDVETKNEWGSWRLEGRSALAISHHGKRVWVAESDSLGEIKIRSSDQEPMGSLTYESPISTFRIGERVRDLFFSSDAQILFGLSSGGAITAWGLTGEGRLETKVFDGIPYDIAASASGHVALNGPFGARVLGPDMRTVLFSRPSDAAQDRVAFGGTALSSDGTRFVFGTTGLLEFGSIMDEPRKVPDFESARQTASVALDPLGAFVASGAILEDRSSDQPKGLSPKEFRVPVLWRTQTAAPVLWVNVDGNKKTETRRIMVAGVAFSPDGRYFAVTQASGTGSEGKVQIYRRSASTSPSTSSFEDPITVPFSRVDPYFVTFSADGKRLAVSGTGSGVMFFDPENGKPLRGNLDIGSKETYRIAYARKGGLMAVMIGDDSTQLSLQLWNSELQSQFGAPISLEGVRDLTGLAFSPDGDAVLMGNGLVEGVVRYDLNVNSWARKACELAGRRLTRQERKIYEVPDEAVCSLAFQGGVGNK